MSESTPFKCSMTFADSWRATRDEINALLGVLIDSLTAEHGVSHVEISGSLRVGQLDLQFVVEDGDMLTATGMVVKALNRGRVSAPGWPDDSVIDGTIGTVAIQKAELIPA